MWKPLKHLSRTGAKQTVTFYTVKKNVFLLNTNNIICLINVLKRDRLN